MSNVLMIIFSSLAALSVTFMLFTRNIMYAAFGLVTTLISLAGIYVLFGAEFVAVSQLMIYVGGIIVLLLFAIMLTQRTNAGVLISGTSRLFIAPFSAAVLLILLGSLLWKFPLAPKAVESDDPIGELGIRLLSEHLVSMELIAMLLLVVLIGAATIAGKFYITNRRRTS
ncbi:NADH-quinone oxidoreductase subunit J [Fulvivirga sedimenti]|uniref:NADH-quinone oxidoreductase subunit J n=1 Tax=Fulvivirga sedimenti TaxID=2879465 RepID=A0A9X1HR18_9BACT|nr:NADH-quinone oxidoreductase subunit J [Fulvivirga sedimenti]MCA6075398.1 NADH-quinone oxidoreductase subunit J [Fulvivirga sedimenti]MCA6076575.1 NADH-quinone oxidoreductase subunit J [Fulvivirga sedimenti]MCA6077703.1 NADH-quinone oxidoreductase subunit J [Fulvivirga sedimenti]